jgi:predicted N-formylglutamate amidohydrolase
MIEVRSDLIADDTSQASMAQTLTGWIAKALQIVEEDACKA